MNNAKEVADQFCGRKLEGCRFADNGSFEMLFKGGKIISVFMDGAFDDKWIDVEIKEEVNTWITSPQSELDREIHELYGTGEGFIKAIKHCRAKRGDTLREAKEYVEKVTGRC